MKSRQRMRIGTGLLVAIAGVTAIGLTPTSAAADPPAPPGDPVQQYKTLSLQATQADEDLLSAQNDLKNKQTQLQQANAQLAAAQAAQKQALATEDQFRGQVDQLASASFEGARMSQISALLTGTSTRDFLDRASFLRDLSADTSSVLRKYQDAVDKAASSSAQAADAQKRAADATAAATQLVATVTQRQADLKTQIATVRAALAKLTAPQRQTLSSVGDTTTVFVAPGATINTILQAALSRRGDEYVWGAAGPTTFDCSGLMLWSFAHANISLPHSSRAQYQMGTPVARGAWQVGDLLFFGSSASTIHHVAMYVGNGEIIQAPTEGVPVQVVPVSQGGNDYYGAKRIVN